MPERRPVVPRPWAPAPEAPDAPVLRLLGIVHSDRRRGALWEAPSGARYDAEVVRHRDLGALVYPGPLRVESPGTEEILEHHRRLEAMLQRETVVPAPFGIGFRAEKEVVRFLRDRYSELGDALGFVEGRWEFRLHIASESPDFPEALALDMATHLYAELRKQAHAAVPFPRGEPSTFSAAFLVDRVGTRAFLEKIEELGRANSDLSLDVTGPWPPYDFVRVRVE